MTTLMQANRQWASRPADERFTSLTELHERCSMQRRQSSGVVVPSRRMHVLPDADNKGLTVVGPNGHPYVPTHHSFGQLSILAEAPARYLRTLPSPIAADCVNYGLQFKRDIEDVGVLLRRNGSDVLAAATGPNYGRIWNSEITETLVKRFGDGVTGHWRVPGEFGKRITVSKENTTLYAGDRDMWVFLADEDRRIELPNRRNGQPGSFARGFFVWNSEVGATTFGLATFLFDYVCCNRIVWGAEQFAEVRIRHTSAAPDRFMDEMLPALKTYAQGSSAGIIKAIEDARAKRLEDKLDDFLANRFGAKAVAPLKAIHVLEEGRPIETVWDVATAITARARSIVNQDERVKMEREAGALLKLAA